MPTKTISLELDAYEKLRRAKRFPRESFSEVVRRAEIPGFGARGRDLLAREVFLDERDFETVDALNANDAPPDIP
ncbi:MAG: antitoxin VapB family protein [Opitutales bacterium]